MPDAKRELLIAPTTCLLRLVSAELELSQWLTADSVYIASADTASFDFDVHIYTGISNITPHSMQKLLTIISKRLQLKLQQDR